MKNVNVENPINRQICSDQSEKENELPKKQRTIKNKKSPSKERQKKFLPKSPEKSPNKSPSKKLKDVLELPFPYDEITSGKLRYWEINSAEGQAVDNEKYPEYEKIRQEIRRFILDAYFIEFLFYVAREGCTC